MLHSICIHNFNRFLIILFKYIRFKILLLIYLLIIILNRINSMYWMECQFSILFYSRMIEFISQIFKTINTDAEYSSNDS